MARPRGSFSIPSYRLHKPSGRALVTIDGKDHYLGPFGTRATSAESWQRYDRLVAEWLARGRQGPSAGNPATATIDQVAASYLAHVSASAKGNKIGSYQRYAMRWLCRFYGSVLAAEFRPFSLTALRQQMVKARVATPSRKGPIDRTLSRDYVNGMIRVIVNMFQWATHQEIVPPSTHHALAAVKRLRGGQLGVREPSKIKSVDDAHVEPVLRLATPTISAMIRLQRLAVMRGGEVCAMRGRDLDTNGPEITRPDGKRIVLWKYQPEHHKTEGHGIERVIYLGPEAQEIIRPFLKPDLSVCLFSPRQSYAESKERIISEATFVRTRVSRRGVLCQRVIKSRATRRIPKHLRDHYDTHSYNQAVTKLCDAADRAARKLRPGADLTKRLVPRWHVHQLRHSGATYLRAKFGLDVAQVVMGHTSAAMAEIYAEPDLTLAANAMASVG